MNEVHMGELLERAIRRKGLNITDLAAALNITRRTLYNWFKQEVIDEVIMERISEVINYDFSNNPVNPNIGKTAVIEPVLVKDEEYWRNRYVDLLERYAKLLQTK
jgi:transcriptional regulator with XRE-family HTH domain